MKFIQQPEVILQELGIDNPEDIDLDLIAYSLQAEVKRVSLSGCEGQIVGTSSQAIITINQDSSPERQRFSLGHELGHWVNDKGKKLPFQCTSSDMNQRSAARNDYRKQKEVRANAFSAELLMPRYMFMPIHRTAPLTGSTINELGARFEASRTSTAIRLVETSDRPCMITCWSRSGNRKWFFRSSTLPETIWPHKAILNPSQSLIESDGLEVDADKWIEGDNSEDYSIIESLFFNGYDYLVLLWWKDESSLIDEDFILD